MNIQQPGSQKIALWCVSAFAVLFLFVRMGAQTKAPFSGMGLSGEYSDPNHPNCIRHIKVAADGIHAYVSGTDGNPGCPQDGSGKAWGLDGTVRPPDTIIVDFSPKGGPKSLEGKRIEAGILWEDQNIWRKKREHYR